MRFSSFTWSGRYREEHKFTMVTDKSEMTPCLTASVFLTAVRPTITNSVNLKSGQRVGRRYKVFSSTVFNILSSDLPAWMLAISSSLCTLTLSPAYKGWSNESASHGMLVSRDLVTLALKVMMKGSRSLHVLT